MTFVNWTSCLPLIGPFNKEEAKNACKRNGSYLVEIDSAVSIYFQKAKVYLQYQDDSRFNIQCMGVKSYGK